LKYRSLYKPTENQYKDVLMVTVILNPSAKVKVTEKGKETTLKRKLAQVLFWFLLLVKRWKS